MVHLILSSSSMSASWVRCTSRTSSMVRDAARSWRCRQCWYGDVRHASSGCELCMKCRETLLNIFLWLYLVRQILAHLNYFSWEKGHWHIVAPFHCFCTTRFNLVMSTVISIKLWSICQSFLFKLQSNCYRPWCRNHGSCCDWWSQAWGSRGILSMRLLLYWNAM